jgi:general secretion pathway protein J
MNNKKGFTLLEILIALFVFTILSIIMSSALHSITTSQSATEKRAARLDELQLALIIISRDFEQAVNRQSTNTNGTDPAMIGAPDFIIFTHAGFANPFGTQNHSTLQRSTYLLENGNLKRSHWPVLDHTLKIKPEERILLTNVSELHFEYLDSQKNFRPSWPPPDQTQSILPTAVRVTLTLKDLGKITQLYLIAGPPIEVLKATTPPPKQ